MKRSHNIFLPVIFFVMHYSIIKYTYLIINSILDKANYKTLEASAFMFAKEGT